jgi:hypothetical protein
MEYQRDVIGAGQTSTGIDLPRLAVNRKDACGGSFCQYKIDGGDPQ